MPTTTEVSLSVGVGAIGSVQPLASRPNDSPLDWIGFCARSFPGPRPRHDFQAAKAYEIYRRAFASTIDDELPRGEHREIVQSEEALAQTEVIMDSLVARGLYTGIAGATGEGRSYREGPRLVETTSRLTSQDRPRELNDVLDAWALEDSQSDADTDRFADEAGQ